MRREMELQLEAWHKLPPGSQEEVSTVEELQWRSCSSISGFSSFQVVVISEHIKTPQVGVQFPL